MNRKVIIGLIISGVIVALGVLVYAYRDQLFPKVTVPDNKVTESTETPDEKPVDPTKHDFMDVDFAQKMIVHNQQGIQMADIAKERAVSEEVRRIAATISSELSTDTQQYVGWLTQWKEPYSNLSDFPEMDGHDMYPTHPGMASLAELDKLRSATGDLVDMQFLSLMIKHHEGSEQMAKYQKSIQFGEMAQLKDAVIKRQAEEIRTMKQLQAKGE